MGRNTTSEPRAESAAEDVGPARRDDPHAGQQRGDGGADQQPRRLFDTPQPHTGGDGQQAGNDQAEQALERHALIEAEGVARSARPRRASRTARRAARRPRRMHSSNVNALAIETSTRAVARGRQALRPDTDCRPVEYPACRRRSRVSARDHAAEHRRPRHPRRPADRARSTTAPLFSSTLVAGHHRAARGRHARLRPRARRRSPSCCPRSAARSVPLDDLVSLAQHGPPHPPASSRTWCTRIWPRLARSAASPRASAACR